MQNKIMQGEAVQGKQSVVMINSQVLGRIESILKETTGLHSASIGSFTIASAVQRRMSACGQDNTDTGAHAYLAQLLVSQGELNALIEEVVIPETWFFRNWNVFDALRHFVSKKRVPDQSQEVLRVLSLPCSTGEEPYSIAMALMDADLPLNRFRIDAMDISTQALARARCAVYGSNAFRGDDLAFRDRFFRHTDAGYALDETIRQSVNFIQANILDTAFMPGQGLYDMVFCRNVMIYFDSLTQTRVVEVLSRLLKPTGTLFVGHAESGIILSHGYVSEHIPGAFAFRKTGSGQRSRPEVQAPVGCQKKITPVFVPPPCLFPKVPQPVAEVLLPTDSLEQAFCLANEGSLAEAADLCETWLEHHEPCVRAYYLLGLIREAAGIGQQAEEYLRKALYLQPDHQEALVHLALLVEQKGDTAAAAVLRQRARRAAEQHALARHHSHTGT